MLYAPSEAFVIFFKMIFVVVTLGVFHSLVLVPTFLTFALDVISTFSSTCDNLSKTKSIYRYIKLNYLNCEKFSKVSLQKLAKQDPIWMN